MTLSEFKKLAKTTNFVERIECMGFKLGPGSFWFYRQRNGFIDVFEFWLKSSKKWVEVPFVCLSGDIIDHCDMSSFPKGFTKGMPILTGSYITKSGIDGSSPWKISDDDTAIQSLDKLASIIESIVEPWFTDVDSNEKLFNSFSVAFRESDNGKNIEKILVG